MAPPSLCDIAPDRDHPSQPVEASSVPRLSIMAIHDWFPEIFGMLDACATLLRTSNPKWSNPQSPFLLGRPPQFSGEIYRSVPLNPPFYLGPATHLTLR